MTSNGWFPKWIIIGFPTLDTWEITSKTPKHINRFDVLCGNSNDAPCFAHCLGHNNIFLRSPHRCDDPWTNRTIWPSSGRGTKQRPQDVWVRRNPQLLKMVMGQNYHATHCGPWDRVSWQSRKTCSCMFCVFLGAGMTKVLFFWKSQDFYPYPYQSGKMAPCSKSLWRCFLNRPWDRF